jgi:hypothetical protein
LEPSRGLSQEFDPQGEPSREFESSLAGVLEIGASRLMCESLDCVLLGDVVSLADSGDCMAPSTLDGSCNCP